MKQYCSAAGFGPRRRGGFSMIEVLITILVLAIGMLGLAALQATSVRSNQSANFRTQATALGYMIIDRMRANSDAVLRGEYLAGLQAGDCAAAPPVGIPQATHDVLAWRQQLACQLPDGQGSISFPGGGQAVVTISWNDERWSLIPSTPFVLTTTL
jgi:type IV pilus assembly protein PilV